MYNPDSSGSPSCAKVSNTQSHESRTIEGLIAGVRIVTLSQKAASTVSNASLPPEKREEWRQLRKGFEAAGLSPELLNRRKPEIEAILREDPVVTITTLREREAAKGKPSGNESHESSLPVSPSSLVVAAQLGYKDLVARILDAGIPVDSVNPVDGRTALHQAAACGHHEVVELLLRRGADKEIESAHENTALIFAAHTDQIETVALLLEKGANVHATTDNGETALHAAAISGVEDKVKILLGYGAAMEATSLNGNTAMHLAAWNGKTKTRSGFFWTAAHTWTGKIL